MTPMDKSIRSSKQKPGLGFTLIELLVVIAIIAILAGMLLPTLAKAKAKGQAIKCMANNRQLTLSWLLYANDNNDSLVSNVANNPNPLGPQGSWCDGWESWGVTPDNTNGLLLAKAKLGPYVGSVAVYKCPADRYLCSEGPAGTRKSPRVRSVSMNGFLEGYGYSRTRTSVVFPTYLCYNKMSDIDGSEPGPVNLWVMVDEHPDSIDDAYLLTWVTNTNQWANVPASYHNGAAGFSFADGHAEIHKWLEGSTVLPVEQVPFWWNQTSTPPNPKGRDIQWMIAHSTAPYSSK
jgi:prepilin-type N-terminal cleavage/methylation domain-containing protein/prepilin-type processing-associated H-X9-DG protein